MIVTLYTTAGTNILVRLDEVEDIGALQRLIDTCLQTGTTFAAKRCGWRYGPEPKDQSPDTMMLINFSNIAYITTDQEPHKIELR